MKGAHFLREDVGLFDAPFFNLAPTEAKVRAFMLCRNNLVTFDRLWIHSNDSCSSALTKRLKMVYMLGKIVRKERLIFAAGVTLGSIKDTPTGVYVGAAQVDYSGLLHKDVDDIPLYQSTGTSSNILSNRLSYVFDLKGPSITMDTACSSSLAALHIACQSLRTGEISQALVCGAHIMLSADTMVGMSMLK